MNFQQRHASATVDISSILKQCNRKNMRKRSIILPPVSRNLARTFKSSDKIKVRSRFETPDLLFSPGWGGK